LKYDVIYTDLIKKYFSSKIIKVLTTEDMNDNIIYIICDDYLELFESKENIKIKEIIDIIKHSIKNDIEKLLFDEEDIIGGLQSKIIKTIIIFDDIDLKNINDSNDHGCEIIVVPKEKCKSFGYLVAIKYFF
jgi:peptide subunit release factor 1 (eRF1)